MNHISRNQPTLQTTAKGNGEFHKLWIGMLLNLITCISLVTVGTLLIMHHMEGPSHYLVFGALAIIIGATQMFPVIKKFI